MLPLPLLFLSSPLPLELPPCEPAYAEVALTGDLMTHRRQLDAATKPDGSFRFHEVFDGVAPLLRGADVAAGNLETTISGEDAGGYSAERERFNTPFELLPALKYAGFDVLQTMNNHTLDRYDLGVDRTLEALAGEGLLPTGTYRTAADRDAGWTVLSAEGIRVGFLAYAEMTEEAADPELTARINMIEPQQRLLDDIARAQEHVDILVVGFHWGEQYELDARGEHRALAEDAVRAGADVIWGTHPHVVQPAEVITLDEPQGPRDALILYSLGNFVSNQRSYPRDGGLIVRVDLAACGAASWISGVRFAPTWVDATSSTGSAQYRIWPTTGTETDCQHPDISARDCARMHRLHDLAATQLPAEQFDVEPGRVEPAWPLRIGDLGWPYSETSTQYDWSRCTSPSGAPVQLKCHHSRQ